VQPLAARNQPLGVPFGANGRLPAVRATPGPRLALGPSLAAAALFALVAPATAASWTPDVKGALRYIHQRKGEVRFAVRTEHRLWGYRRTEGVHALSVVKALLLVAYLDDPRVRGRPLRAADDRLIDPMIRRSDNQAATRVLDYVGPARVRATARRAGMRRFRLVPAVWGASRIDASDQTRFFLHFEAHVAPRHRATALHLLRTVVPSQRWGVARARHDGWRLYFKGGWGDGTDVIEHQVALLRSGAHRVAVAVLTSGNPARAYGEQTLRGVFARLLRGLAAQDVLTPT
jgi:beta-lactamase family protein